jgi:orotidine-5'-phosphate decarboxylase
VSVQAAPRDRLIVALDCGADEAVVLADALAGTVRWLKVGMTLFYQHGPRIVETLRDKGFDIFLDLKLHDIPHQVGGAAQVVAGLGVQMLTVHASGGPDMIRAAVEGARSGAAQAGIAPPAVLAISVLTSISDEVLGQVGVGRDAAGQVELLSRLAMESGADGIVCSPLETPAVRAIVGAERLVVTPGVRPVWSEKDDQSRVTTPADALARGASHLVIGRPITGADSPAQAAALIISEMEEGLR